MRAGLAQVLETAGDVELVGTAANGAEALRGLPARAPGRRADGPLDARARRRRRDAAARRRAPGGSAWSCSRRSLIASASSTRSTPARPATCSRTPSRASSWPAVRAASRGESPLAPRAASAVLRGARRAAAAPTNSHERELDVLALVGAGASEQADRAPAGHQREDRQEPPDERLPRSSTSTTAPRPRCGRSATGSSIAGPERPLVPGPIAHGNRDPGEAKLGLAANSRLLPGGTMSNIRRRSASGRRPPKPPACSAGRTEGLRGGPPTPIAGQLSAASRRLVLRRHLRVGSDGRRYAPRRLTAAEARVDDRRSRPGNHAGDPQRDAAHEDRSEAHAGAGESATTRPGRANRAASVSPMHGSSTSTRIVDRCSRAASGTSRPRRPAGR